MSALWSRQHRACGGVKRCIVARRPLTALLVTGLATLLLLDGCGGGHQGTRTPPPYQLSGASCLRQLQARGVSFVPRGPVGRGSCRIDTPVEAVALRSMRIEPRVLTSCAMLVALSDLEADIQNAARSLLQSPVAVLNNRGSYACRGMSGNSSRLSLHAQARAFDISGVTLRNGQRIEVEDDWGRRRPERRFLHVVRDAACRRLSVVLSPDSDRYHQDHIHVDLGPWRLCG